MTQKHTKNVPYCHTRRHPFLLFTDYSMNNCKLYFNSLAGYETEKNCDYNYPVSDWQWAKKENWKTLIIILKMKTKLMNHKKSQWK